MNVEYHYPPDLFNLLVDTIPRLCRTKRDVLMFFRGAGVSPSLLSGPQSRLSSDRQGISKFEIVRTVLMSVNDAGDNAIRERREVVKRVVEFEDFSTCWEDDRLQAQGLVANVRNLVNVKDSFTRINQEREAEVLKYRESEEAKTATLRRHRERMAGIRRDLYSLFSMKNASERGLLLEAVLNQLFDAEGILIRESFRRVASPGQGVIEQIDGVIQLEGHIYLVEMKWLKDPVGVGDISRHIVRVVNRDSSRGIFISYSGYTIPAIETCKESLSNAVIVLCTLEEFVFLLEKEASLEEFLTKKIQRSIVDRQPFEKAL